ncbi:hypothetical protein ANN_12662 [Periplaneta americana]|uniref:Uncharacterized protein n=1 Tax=Periplaneta americana TaxID=6978 RepID=A0ABQ8TH65_PERAM|nr:hypothetical protein ANN_12662 [Periplaneta americana]
MFNLRLLFSDRSKINRFYALLCSTLVQVLFGYRIYITHEVDNAEEMSPASSAESYSAFQRIPNFTGTVDINDVTLQRIGIKLLEGSMDFAKFPYRLLSAEIRNTLFAFNGLRGKSRKNLNQVSPNKDLNPSSLVSQQCTGCKLRRLNGNAGGHGGTNVQTKSIIRYALIFWKWNQNWKGFDFIKESH